MNKCNHLIALFSITNKLDVNLISNSGLLGNLLLLGLAGYHLGNMSQDYSTGLRRAPSRVYKWNCSRGILAGPEPLPFSLCLSKVLQAPIPKA